MRALLLSAAFLVLGATAARAQDESALAHAEQAYLRVDFETTLASATAAIEAGRLSPEQLTRAYQLAGVAAAALEQEDASRDAYTRMLALDPDREVDRNLAPRLRSPFLEARGFWTARSDRLGADVGVDREAGTLEVRLGDPLSMAQLVVVWARPAGTARWQQIRRPAAPHVDVPIEGAGAPRIEYALAVLDFHGNRLIEQGTPDAPRSLGEAPVAAVTAAEAGSDDGGSVLTSPVFWAIAGAVVIGAGVGAYLLLSDDATGVQTSVSFGVR